MSGSRLISEGADLAVMPKARERQGNDPVQLTIGDLHGNALKLVHMLIREGVLTMPEADYDALYRIYNRTPLNRDDLHEFNDILRRSQVNLDNLSVVRLVGDELCDRGMNDFLTLLVFNQMQQKGIPYSIIFSNHSSAFISVCAEDGLESAKKFDAATTDAERQKAAAMKAQLDPRNTAPIPEEYPCYIESDYTGLMRQDRSLQGLGQLIAEGVVSANEVKTLLRNYYAPHLKLLDYSFDATTNTVTLYAHNHIGLDSVRALANRYLGQDGWRVDTPEGLMQTIDEINHAFRERVLDTNNNFKPGVVAEKECPEVDRVIMARLNEYEQAPELGNVGHYHVHAVHGHQGARYARQYNQYYGVTNYDETSANTDSDLGKYNQAPYDGSRLTSRNEQGTYVCHVGVHHGPALAHAPHAAAAAVAATTTTTTKATQPQTTVAVQPAGFFAQQPSGIAVNRQPAFARRITDRFATMFILNVDISLIDYTQGSQGIKITFANQHDANAIKNGYLSGCQVGVRVDRQTGKVSMQLTPEAAKQLTERILGESDCAVGDLHIIDALIHDLRVMQCEEALPDRNLLQEDIARSLSLQSPPSIDMRIGQLKQDGSGILSETISVTFASSDDRDAFQKQVESLRANGDLPQREQCAVLYDNRNPCHVVIPKQHASLLANALHTQHAPAYRGGLGGGGS